MNERRHQACGCGRSHARLVFGGVIIVAGVLLFLDRQDVLPFRLALQYIWPVLLIVLGLVRFTAPAAGPEDAARERYAGAWLLFLGAWGLVSELRLFGLGYGNSWPLLVIGTGVLIVWKALQPPQHGRAGDREAQ